MIRTLRLLRQREAPPIPELASHVLEQGPAVVELLLEISSDGVVPACDDGEPQVVSIYQEELIAASLELFGRELVLPSLRVRLESADTRDLAAALRGLGAVGVDRDLELILDQRFERDAELEPWLAEAFQKGLAGILRRDPDAMPFLTLRWRNVDPALLSPLVSALGEAGDPRGVEILGDVITWHSHLASAAVGQLRRLGPHPSPEVNEEIANDLRPALDAWSSSPGDLRAVILAIGELQDFHSIPVLIELMRDEASGLRANALWALRRMTGMTLGEDPDFWSDWYEAEQAWFLDERSRVRSQLELSDPAQVARALRDYSSHRMFRHELAEDLATVLWRDETHLRTLACSVLAQLGSPRPVRDLVALLEESQEEVREAAHGALMAITGLDLPVDAQAWREATDPDF